MYEIRIVRISSNVLTFPSLGHGKYQTKTSTLLFFSYLFRKCSVLVRPLTVVSSTHTQPWSDPIESLPLTERLSYSMLKYLFFGSYKSFLDIMIDVTYTILLHPETNPVISNTEVTSPFGYSEPIISSYFHLPRLFFRTNILCTKQVFYYLLPLSPPKDNN